MKTEAPKPLTKCENNVNNRQTAYTLDPRNYGSCQEVLGGHISCPIFDANGACILLKRRCENAKTFYEKKTFKTYGYTQNTMLEIFRAL
jgi:hypothetical protein